MRYADSDKVQKYFVSGGKKWKRPRDISLKNIFEEFLSVVFGLYKVGKMEFGNSISSPQAFFDNFDDTFLGQESIIHPVTRVFWSLDFYSVPRLRLVTRKCLVLQKNLIRHRAEITILWSLFGKNQESF